jgi:hypothetical protein
MFLNAWRRSPQMSSDGLKWGKMARTATGRYPSGSARPEVGPEADSRSSDERTAYVERVRSAVMAGSYRVDSHRVAERLLERRALDDVT